LGSSSITSTPHFLKAARSVMVDDAILLGTQGLNGSLRGQVEIVGAQTNHLAPKRVERVTEQQQLAAGVDVAALPAPAIPVNPISTRSISATMS
jgi:hypothetical protein